MIVLHYLINLYMLIIVLAGIFSLARLDNEFARFFYRLSDPVLHFISAHINLVYQGIDFSPFALLVVLGIIDRIIWSFI